MKSINFDTGWKSYIVNDDESAIARINVSDLNLRDRISGFLADMEQIRKEYEGKENSTPDDLKKLDKPMREKLNEAFGCDISTPAFGAVNCMSILTSGKTVMQSFLEALTPIIMQDVEEYRQKLVGKYLDGTDEAAKGDLP